MNKRLYLLLTTCILAIAGHAQNTFPSTGKVGIGTASPVQLLHIRSGGVSSQAWAGVDKNSGEECGYQFLRHGSVLFYQYSDNSDNDALKIQSTGVQGEGDATPRIHIPYSSPNLYLVQSGGNVGVGTTSPAHKLDVNGVINASGILINGAPFAGGGSQWATSGSNISFTATNGKVGIGTANPLNKVTAVGMETGTQPTTPPVAKFINSGNEYSKLVLGSDNANYDAVISMDNSQVLANTKLRLYIGNGTLSTAGHNNDQIVLTGNGNVGIGTSDPKGYRLAIAGKAVAEEIVVKLQSAWPDYVFEDTYKPMNLSELERYIKDNKHLPEIPAAEEVKENGLSVGEMNALLLKKVEELTLHMIEQNKKIEKQQQELDRLKNFQDKETDE